MTPTRRLDDAPLPRPVSERPGPGDDAFFDLVEARFRRLVERDPVTASWLGLHDADDRLGDPDREALLDDVAADRAHLTAVEGVDAAGLSSAARFDRDLELHNLRRELFEAEELRTWERRSTALDLVGDSLFLLISRDHAPLAERLGRDHGSS